MAASDEKVTPPGRGAGPESSIAHPRRCQARIEQVQKRWLMLRRFLAVSLLLAVASVSGAIVVGLDAWLRGGHLTRSMLLLACVASVVWVSRRFAAPLWDRLSHDKAALLLEHSYPKLAGRLVTAVQLATPTIRERSGTSVGLYRQVQTAAEEAAGRLDPVRVLPGRSPLQRAAVAWGLVLLLLVVAGLNREGASIGIARVLMPWRQIDWPQRTRLHITAADERVVRGGTLEIAGKVSGVVPATGTLHVQSGTGAADRARFNIGQDGAFTVRYRPVNDDLNVSLEVGDARSQVLHVEMIPPPEIIRVEAECTYPAYTHMAPERLSDGNVQAVFGSRIRLRVTTNKAVASAALSWDDKTTIAMELMGEDEAEARFNVDASRSYRVHLTDELGFQNEEPVVYRIEMIDNLYPRIERVTPTADKRVTPQAMVPITALVTDDFGVTGLTLCYQRGEEHEAQQVTIPLEHPGKVVAARYVWSLEPLGLQPGDTISYRLQAQDAGEHAARSDWPVSRWRRLHVLDEPELARLLSDQLEQILHGLAELEVLQGECTSAVVRVNNSLDALPPGARPAPAARQRTQAEKWRQDHLARNAGQLAARLGRVAEDYAISRIGRPERAQRLQRTADQLAKISATHMPGIVLHLDEALVNLRELVAPPTTRPPEKP